MIRLYMITVNKSILCGTIFRHLGKLKMRILVWMGKLASYLKLYVDGARLWDRDLKKNLKI